MKKYFLLFGLLFLVGCGSAQSNVKSEPVQKLTVGTVQKEIRLGMTAAQVAEILGSPNIVTTDENRREVWIYDKISTEVSSSSSESGVWFILIGGSNSKASSSKVQKTLTVIIKYDENSKVRDFAYHTSQF